MFYNVLKAKDIVNLDETKFDRQVLMENGDSCLNIIAIKKGEIIDTHTSIADAAVYVIDGEIELHFDAEKFKLDKGEILMFKKDKEHKVHALKDSKFLLIKIYNYALKLYRAFNYIELILKYYFVTFLYNFLPYGKSRVSAEKQKFRTPNIL